MSRILMLIAGLLVCSAVCAAPAAAVVDDEPDTAKAGTSSGWGTGAFDVGARVGYGVPVGDLRKNTSTSGLIEGVIPVQIDAFYRLTHRWRIGLSGSYGIGVAGDQTQGASNGTTVSSASVDEVRALVGVQYHLAPFASQDPWFGVSTGLSWLRGDGQVEALGKIAKVSTSTMQVEFINVHGGLQFKLSDAFYVGPFAAVGLQQALSTTMTSTAASTATTTEAEIPSGDRTLHAWFTVGVSGSYGL